MGKSAISQRWQVIGIKAAGSTVSHIAQTMQMSQRTVYSIGRRHRENPGDVKDRPRSERRRATTTAAGTLHEDAYYTPYYTLSSTIKIGNVIKYVFCQCSAKLERNGQGWCVMVVFQSTQPQGPEIPTFCTAGTVTQAIKQKVNTKSVWTITAFSNQFIDLRKRIQV